MAYITKNGLRIQSNGLTLVTKDIDPIPGQINLLASGDGVEFDSVPSITGSKTIKADLFIDSSLAGMTLWFQTVSINDYLLIVIGNIAETSTFGLTVQTRGPVSTVRRYYNINSYLNQITSIEIVKTSTSITSVKMGGDTLSGTNGFFSPSDTTSKSILGAGGISIWNLEIEDNHKWIGYPYGNTNAAWVDTIGSNNGTVTGSPGTKNLL